MHLWRTRLDTVDLDLCWLLLYTKARAESWADINLRKQGLSTLLPRVRHRGGFAPLFPRYLFVGAPAGTELRSARSTRGVLYVVHCGKKPARVPLDVVVVLKGPVQPMIVVPCSDDCDAWTIPEGGTAMVYVTRESKRAATAAEIAQKVAEAEARAFVERHTPASELESLRVSEDG